MSVSTVVSIAQAELARGLKEPEAYARYSGGRAEPWCAHFANWVYEQAGAPLPNHRKPHVGPGGEDPMAGTSYAFSTFLLTDRVFETPRLGDLMFYRRKTSSGQLDPNPTKMGHVGIVVGIEGDTVVLIEGNLSDKVAQVRKSLSDPQIAGFARPLSGGGLGGVVLVGAAAVGGVLLWRKLRTRVSA